MKATNFYKHEIVDTRVYYSHWKLRKCHTKKKKKMMKVTNIYKHEIVDTRA